MKNYIVIGLGRFGSEVARRLCQLGCEVLALDNRADLVQQISSDVTHAVVGDARDKSVLRALGAQVEETEKEIRVQAGGLHGSVLDMSDCPDIAPILALTCQLAEGESRLTGCGRLRIKECDRLAATVESLNLLGGNAKAEGDTIVIQGVKALKGGVTLPNYNDHRMVMLGMVAASIAKEPVMVQGVEALNKSWPEFVNVYKELGGKAE